MQHFCSHCGKPLLDSARFCTYCGSSLMGGKSGKERWREKREEVIGHRSPMKGHTGRLLLIFLVTAFGGGLIYFNLPDNGNPMIKAEPAVVEPARYPTEAQQMYDTPSRVQKGKIILSLDVVRQKQFVAFSYQTSSDLIPLLAYVSGDGKIITAVSMCEPCNSRRFHIQGETIVCNSCGTTWKINDLSPVSGSCGKYPPDVVPNTVEGNEVQIDEKVVAQWQRRV